MNRARPTPVHTLRSSLEKHGAPHGGPEREGADSARPSPSWHAIDNARILLRDTLRAGQAVKTLPAERTRLTSAHLLLNGGLPPRPLRRSGTILGVSLFNFDLPAPNHSFELSRSFWGKPISSSHSSTRAAGNFDRLLVQVGTTEPILRKSTSEISSSDSPAMPLFESRMARASTSWALGFGSGNGQRRSSNQHSLSCSSRSALLMTPSLSAAKVLESIPKVTPRPWGTTPSP